MAMVALLLLVIVLDAVVVALPSGCEEGFIPWAWIKALNEIVLDEPWEDPVHSQKLPVQLLPWLWLSDQASVELSMSGLHRLGITHVLSTNAMETHELEHMKSETERFGMQHYVVNDHDEDGYNNEGGYNMIENHWDKCRSFLQEVQESGGKVVIHYSGGINRSGLIACAALMVFEQRCVLDVVKFAKKKRFTLLTNRSFQRQLCILAAREGLLGSKPDGFTDDPPSCRGPIDFGKFK